MASNSKIEWTTHTFNPWRGCTKVSEGCKHCYAETLSKRNPKVLGMWGPQGTRVMASESMWREPLKWNEEARAAGERHRVFCASLADVFEGQETCSEEAYQVIQEARVKLFQLIDRTPNLDWLLLTKRPENIEMVLRLTWTPSKASLWHKLEHGLLSNVWFGTSVENQAAADKRIPALLDIPAKYRFLSCEPLLGPVDLEAWIPAGAKLPLKNYPEGFETWHTQKQDKWFADMAQHVYMARAEIGIHWVIAGGESGPHARPMHPDWARSLRDQCQSAGVAFFFKQWGDLAPFAQLPGDFSTDSTWPDSRLIQHLRVEDAVHGDDPCPMYRVGKKNAGRLLDGRTWDELPTVEAPHA